MSTTKPARNQISKEPTRVFVTIMLDISEGYDPEDVIDELPLDCHDAVEYWEVTFIEVFQHPYTGE